jgi:cystathionine beta-lyase
MKKETIIVTTGRDISRQEGSVNPVISQTSTILFPTLEAYHEAGKGNSCYESAQNTTASDPSYGLGGTSTTFALQNALVELEQGDDCLITSSGLSAITMSLTACLRAGDHILVVDSVYGPTRRFCNKDLKRFGVDVTYYDPRIGAGIGALIQENTKVIYLESPGSQTFEVQDVPAIVAVAKKHEIITMLDNCWASPLYYNPLAVGVDVCIQAVTKYIGGHSDIVLGAIITKGAVGKKVIKEAVISGASVSPFDCWLALRGLRTLSARMERHSRTTAKIIEFIKSEPKVAKLLFPADVDSPDYELWKSQFSGAASLFSVVLDKKYPFEEICAFANSLKLFGIGASWGGFESLVLDFDPTEGTRTVTEWNEKGSCVRFYIGLEDADDLLADLKQGFAKL